MLQFHKYWSSPDTPSIARFLEVRDRLRVPIYMGEGGENTLEWLYTAFRLYETHGIGWNFWPWKKIDTRTSPASVDAPDGWDRVVASVSGTPALSRDQSRLIFAQLLENMRVENCRWQPDIVAALIADRPAAIPAWGFGFRGEGESYAIGDRGNLPTKWIRADDGVPLRFAAQGAATVNPFEQTDGRAYHEDEELVVDLLAGDWLEFEMEAGIVLSDARALGTDGDDLPVILERSVRGLRVTATAPATLAKIVMG
jgi:hypothetical protein